MRNLNLNLCKKLYRAKDNTVRYRRLKAQGLFVFGYYIANNNGRHQYSNLYDMTENTQTFYMFGQEELEEITIEDLTKEERGMVFKYILTKNRLLIIHNIT